mgnify:CR=1 FL=1
MAFDPDQIQKALDLTEKSERMALVLPAEPDLDCLASAEAIYRALEAKNKIVGLVARPKFELRSNSVHELLAKLSASTPLIKEFVISVNTSQSPVSQLRYEKEENELRIILSPKSSAVNAQAVSFSEGKITCDAIIAIGVSNTEQLRALTGFTSDVLAEIPILNMDISAENKKYGTANLISDSPSSFTEAAYYFIHNLPNASFTKELATLILTGIMYRTNSFRSHSLSADSHSIASEMMRNGANYRIALELAYQWKPLELLQLFGRASVRSKINPDDNVLWSFITEEDFRKTGRSRSDIPSVLHHLETMFPPHQLRIVLWQDSGMKDVHATLAGDTALLEILSSRIASRQENQLLEISSLFQTFQEAETAIALIIKETAAGR